MLKRKPLDETLRSGLGKSDIRPFERNGSNGLARTEEELWVPPVAGLLAGIIGFAVILIVSNNWIGAAGVGIIIFFVTWRNLKKYY